MDVLVCLFLWISDRININQFFLQVIEILNLPATSTTPSGSTNPLFGRTQYLFGAVVFTLKHTFFSVGFVSLRFAVTTFVKDPAINQVNSLVKLPCILTKLD